jgi:hypothetical protein
MSLQPKPCYEVPEETARVVRAAFPQGTLCTRIYDALGTIFQDAESCVKKDCSRLADGNGLTPHMCWPLSER